MAENGMIDIDGIRARVALNGKTYSSPTISEIDRRELLAAYDAVCDQRSFLLATNSDLRKGRDMLTDRLAEAERQRDALLDHCADPECMECGRIMCPQGEPLHFHHDGCPVCMPKDIP